MTPGYDMHMYTHAQVALYNGANREVAILCNHQRTVSNAQKDNLQKMEDKLKLLTKQRQVCRYFVQSFLFFRNVLSQMSLAGFRDISTLWLKNALRRTRGSCDFVVGIFVGGSDCPNDCY